MQNTIDLLKKSFVLRNTEKKNQDFFCRTKQRTNSKSANQGKKRN